MSRQRLNAVQIAEFFAIAGQRRDAAESERIEAIDNLLHELRLQIEQYRKGERSEIDHLLMQGIKEWGLQIFAQADPVLALARFLGKRQKPGKRAKYSDRDFSIALAVITRREDGMTVEKACELVAADYGLDDETIRKIFRRRNKEVRAARHQI
jgi:hypothetical protein